MRWIEHDPADRVQYLSLLVAEVDVWQVPAEKLLGFVNSEILFRKLGGDVLLAQGGGEFGGQVNSAAAQQQQQQHEFGGDLKLAVERIVTQRCDSPSASKPHGAHQTHSKKIRHSYEQEVPSIGSIAKCFISALYRLYWQINF